MKGIKLFGLAAVAVVALMAFCGVASASSGVITAGEYPASIVGEASGRGELGTDFGQAAPACTPTLAGSLSQPSQTLATLPSNCGFEKTGCEFAFHPVAGSINGTMDIDGCASFEKVTGLGCTVTVLSKRGLAATFENQGSGATAAIKVQLNATGLEYSSPNCNPKGTVFTDGTYKATWILHGEHAGKSTGLTVSNCPGLSIVENGGGEFHSPCYSAMVEGEQMSGVVGGKTIPKLELSTAAGNVKCATATFNGAFPTGGLIEDSTELLMAPTSAGCTVGGFIAVTVTPKNGCSDNFVITSGAPYMGRLFQCETVVTFSEGRKCTITVPAQAHAGMEYANVGSGSSEVVEAKANLSGLSYQIANGSECPNAPASGSYVDGKYKGVIKLSAA